MGFSENIGFALSQYFARFFSGWVRRTTAHSVLAERNGMRFLRYHRANEVSGWIGMIVFGGLMVGGAFIEFTAARWFVILGSAAILSVFVWLIFLARRSAVIYGGDEIHYFPIDGAPISFSWGDVASVEWSASSDAWFIELGDGRKARLGGSMHGGLQFMEVLQKRTGIVPEMPDWN